MVPPPETLHVTEPSETPVSEAENCAVPPAETLLLVGLTEIVGATRFTVAEAESELTALLVAVTVAVVAEFTVAGAV